MKINKTDLKRGYDGTFNDLVAVMADNGITVVDGVLVKPGDVVTARGYKHKSYVVMPKGQDRTGRTPADAISIADPNGAVKHIRTSKTEINGKPAGLFLKGQRVIGYVA